MFSQVKFHCWSLLLAAVTLLAVAAPVAARPTSAFQKRLSPGSVRVLQKVQQLNEQEKYRESLAVLDQYRAERQGKVAPLVDFMAGNLSFQLDDYARAAAAYRRAIATAPDFDEAYENLGAALLMLKKYREAVKVLLEAAARRPEKAEKLRYQAALGALYGEDYRRARKLLAGLVEKKPRPPADWLKALLQAELELKQPAAAARTAARLVDLYPEKEEHWRLYAQILLAAERYRPALSAYKVLQANGQLKPDEYKVLAGIYQQLGLPGEAASAWEAYLEKSKSSADRKELESLVALYRQVGQFDRALEVVSRIAKLAPGDARLDFLRGEILYQAGRWKEARRAFNRVGKLPDAKQEGRQYLLAGYCAWNENDFPAAARAWQQAATYPKLRRRAAKLLKSLEPWLEEAGKEEETKKQQSSG